MESRKFATYADLFDLPETVNGEILHGMLHTSPRPGPAHAATATRLSAILSTAHMFGIGGPGGWQILFEPELHLDGHVLVPDLAGWRVENLPTRPELAYFTARPDWVCEVLSPGNAQLDRMIKMQIYAEAGVPNAWLVDPIERLIETYTLSEGTWARRSVVHDQTDARLVPFDAVPFDVNLLWW